MMSVFPIFNAIIDCFKKADGNFDVSCILVKQRKIKFEPQIKVKLNPQLGHTENSLYCREWYVSYCNKQGTCTASSISKAAVHRFVL